MPLRKTIHDAVSYLFAYIKTLSVSFWIRIVLIVTLGVVIGYFLEEQQITANIRFYSYRVLQKVIPRKQQPNYTAIVLIGDEEYWKDPQLAHRTPINRAYLAKLLRAINDADPTVIGLDFDLRAPLPDENQADDPAYHQETDELVKTYREVSRQTPVILPKAIGTNYYGEYVLEPDVYDAFGISAGTDPALHSFGYIALPFDPRVLPQTIAISSGKELMSFSEALVYAYDPKRVPANSGGHGRGLYAGYINQNEFKNVTFYATEILKDPQKFKRLFHPKVVLVGGSWHSRAYDRGGIIDLHLTAAGSIPGVFVHANYVEAMLDLRTFPGLNLWLRLTLEWVLTFILAFCVQLPAIRERDWAALAIIVFLIVFGAIGMFYVFAILFEFALPVCAIFAHYSVEKILHWRKLANHTTETRAHGLTEIHAPQGATDNRAVQNGSDGYSVASKERLDNRTVP